MIKTLPSYWKGTLFRSRTEARWAVFFDAIELKWEYEPEGYRLEDDTMYLPDFWLPEMGMWVEIKPSCGATDAERTKVGLLVRGTGHRCLVLDGAPWPKAFNQCWPANIPDGFEWLDACFSDEYTLSRADGAPRLFTDPTTECEIWNPDVTAAMATARRIDLKDADAGHHLPLGWEGFEAII